MKTYHDDEAAPGEDKKRETGLRLLPPPSDCKQTLARSRRRPTATTSENETLKDETLEKQVLKASPPLLPLKQGFFWGEISPNGDIFPQKMAKMSVFNFSFAKFRIYIFFKRIARFHPCLQQEAKNIDGCYNFFYFHILSSPNLAKLVLWMITT